MVFSSRNPISIVKGGVETRLDTLAYNISTREGVATSLTQVRGGGVEVAGRSGSFYSPGGKREEGQIVLEMWVADDGVNGANSPGYRGWRENLDMLNRLFDTTSGQIEVREYVTGLTNPSDTLVGKPYRRALCEVRAAVQPTMDGRWYGEFVVDLAINRTYWEDGTASTFTSPTGASAVATHTMTALAGGSAPIEDANITVTGPITNPTLYCAETDSTLRYNGTIATGNQWVVNTTTYRSQVGAGIETTVWNGGAAGTSGTANTVYSGPHSPTMFPIGPSAVVQLSGSGAGAGTNLKINARKKYH